MTPLAGLGSGGVRNLIVETLLLFSHFPLSHPHSYSNATPWLIYGHFQASEGHLSVIDAVALMFRSPATDPRPADLRHIR